MQVTWIGYPNSTGLAAIDYRFSDLVCDPLETQQTFVEELVHLPGCFLCYTPAHNAPPVGPPPAQELGFVTFGSFNALAKITPEVIRLWARVLRAVPGSRLLLKNKPFACEHARRHFLGQVRRHRLDRCGQPACCAGLVGRSDGAAKRRATMWMVVRRRHDPALIV